MAINPTSSLSTPILTYATAAHKKAVGMENEEDKPRPLPPVEQSDKGEKSANRKRDPNRIEDELPERQSSHSQNQQQEPTEQQDDVSFSDLHGDKVDPDGGDYPERAKNIDDMLFIASKGLSRKDSGGVK